MPDELKTTLGFEAEQAIATLKQLELSLNNYTIAMGKAAKVTKQYNRAAAGVDKQFKRQTSSIKQYNTSQANLTKQSKQTKTALKDIGNTGTETGKQIQHLSDVTKKTSNQMILSWQSVIRIFAIQVIHQMISKATNAMQESIGSAIDLEIQFAEIQTIGGRLKENFEGVASGVRELSDEFGISADIVAEGTYQTLSNQVAEAENAFTFFAAAADFSVASVTSADAAVNLLTSTINAFGYNASQTAVIAGKLFKTIELGRIRGEEFANTFGRIAVLASRVGVSLDEVLAAIATLTISGLRYNEAFTLINNVMLKLIRPTDAMKNTFKDLGIVTLEAGIQAYGFQGLLDKLTETTDGTVSELGELFGRVRAIRGALGLTGTAAEKVTKNLEAIRAAGVDTLAEAKELIFETNAKQVQIEIEELKNAIVFDFGRNALDIINKVTDAFGGLVNIVKIAGFTAGIAAVGFGALFVMFHPIAAAILGISSAIGGLAFTYKRFSKTAIESIKEVEKEERKRIAAINAAEGELAEQRIEHFRKQISSMQRYLVDRLVAINKIKEEAIKMEGFISGNLEQQLSDRKSAFNNFVKAISKSMEQAKTNINKSQGDIFSLQLKMSNEIFEGQQRSRDQTQQALSNIQRATELARKASKAFTAGYQDRAQLLFGESEQLLEQAKSIAMNIENYGLEGKARTAILGIMKTQVDLQKKMAKGEVGRYQQLAAQLPIEKARSQRIGFLLEKLKEYKLFTEKGIIEYPSEQAALAAIMPILNALQQEFDEAGTKVNIFKRLEETGAKDLQTALTKALEPFEDVFTALPVSLKFLYKERAQLIFKDIQNIADDIPIDIKLKFEKMGFDISTLKGIEEASKGLVKTFEAIERSVRASSSLKGKQEELKTTIGTIHQTADEVANSFARQLGVIGTLTEAMKHPRELAERVLALDIESNNVRAQAPAIMEQQVQLLNQINASAALALQNIKGTFDPERFTMALTSLQGAQLQLNQIGQTDVSKNIILLIEKLQQAAREAQEIQQIEIGTEIQFGEEALGRLEEVFRAQADTANLTITTFGEVGSAAQGAASTANSAFSSMTNSLNSLEAQAKRTAAAVASIGSGSGSKKEALGGLIYRQSGGFAPRGTDTIPAMLSPGEFVVNANSSRKFFSQLMAINSGIKPVYRESGGPVTTIGDVSITVEGAPTPKQTARETMSAFRREMRKRTSSL